MFRGILLAGGAVLLFIFLFGLSAPDKPATIDITNYKLPKYEVIEKVKLIDGSVYAAVLMKSYSIKTKNQVLEKAAFALSKKLKTDEVVLYSTRRAHKANFSAKYSKKYPNALKTGYLGAYKNNIFTPPMN